MFFRHTLLLGLTLWPCAWTALAAAVPGETIPVSSAWHYRAWRTEDGLPDNMVTGVAQSADGFLWVATFGGLMRFDGAKFDGFSLFHLPDIPNRVVRQLAVDSAGRFWLAMDRGPVVCADKHSARVFTVRDGLLDSQVVGMVADGAGGMWLLYGADILHIANGKVARLDTDPDTRTSGYSWWVTQDANGKAWFARGNELGTFQDGKWHAELRFDQLHLRLAPMLSSGLWVCAGSQLFRYDAGKPPVQLAQLPANVQVQTMLGDRTGAVWIGTASHGLFRWFNGVLERIPTANSQIQCVTEDREGNIWVGTEGGGLNRLRPRIVQLIGTADGLPVESVRCITEDRDAVRWALTDNGILVHEASSKWVPADESDGWPGVTGNCLAADREGAVWVGTSRSSLIRLLHGKTRYWRRAQGFSGNPRCMLAAANGDLWVATSGRGRLFRLRDGVLQPATLDVEIRNPRALAEAPDGMIWVATAEGQLLRVDPETMTGQVEEADERLSIRSLLATPDGSLWVGYAGAGIFRWKNGSYEQITQAQGLYDDYVSQMQSDDRGYMWINSNHGLFRVQLQRLVNVANGAAMNVNCIIYGRGEGLPSLQPAYDYYPDTCRTADGQLWFATRNGLLSVMPDRINDSTNATPVVLERVTVDDRVVALWNSHSSLRPHSASLAVDLHAPDAHLTLAPAHRKIRFEFAALRFASVENINIRYRLEDFDKDWIDAGSQRAATYPRLPAGHYEFQIQADNRVGVWDEAVFRLPIDVAPFFWQTWWFRSASLLFFTGCVVGLVRFFSFRRLKRRLQRLEYEQALHHERARIARDMHDEVGSKLSRLSLLSEMASQGPEMPASACREVAEISETARDTIRSLEEIVWAVNPKNDTLANLIHYLCRFAEDFFEGGETECVFEIPDNIPAIELPTDLRHHVFLAAKEALNNVCKHAAAHRVCLRVGITTDGFEISIEDDGRGMTEFVNTSGGRSGNGLGNMRERMRQAGGQFEIHSRPGGGTRVTFRLRYPCTVQP